MIPVCLRFSGLNSYRSLQEIDFTALTGQGLFGIFGVTGAGKSTILDAITLALFGKVKRSPRSTQGIINSQEKTCFVSFTFDLGPHRYVAERQFERVKNEPFSAGTKSFRLLKDDIPQADKISAMDEAIKTLFHMDFERFCQTVILPQGQFDQLLKLKPSDRSTMLEELFHFSDYGDRLTRRCREQLKLAEAEFASLEEQLALLGSYSKDDLAQLQTEIAAGQQLLEQMQADYQAAQQRQHQLQSAALAAKTYAACVAALEKMELDLPALTEQHLAAERAEKAEPLRAMLDEAVRLNQQQRTAQEASLLAAEETAAKQTVYQQASAIWQQARSALAAAEAASTPQLEKLKQAIHSQQALQQEQARLTSAEQDFAQSGLAKQVAAAEAAYLAIQEKLQQSEHAVSQLAQQVKTDRDAWEQAVSELDQLRSSSAVQHLLTQLQPGQPCPVCGSLTHPARPERTAQAVEENAVSQAEQRVRTCRQQWQQSETSYRDALTGQSEQQKEKDQAQQAWVNCRQRLTEQESALQILRQSYRESLQRWQDEVGIADPAAALQQIENQLAELGASAEQAGEQAKQAEAAWRNAELAAMQRQSFATASETQLEDYKKQLLEAVHAAGFAEAKEAKAALLPALQRQQIQQAWNDYDSRRRELLSQKNQLAEAHAGYQPNSEIAAQQQAAELGAQLSLAQQQQGGRQAALQQAEEAMAKAAQLQVRRTAAAANYELLKRLANLLKGNAFVRYLAKNSMLELAHEASDILVSLTAHRFRLELFEDTRGSDFLVVDLYNGGQKRQVTGLSGGETFLVSLALALALSRKIEMGSTPLGFFFLDEGFGSLDENSLEAALSVLERLPSDKRAVGVITHVKGVRERVPRYLEVTSDLVAGSQVKMYKN